MLFYNHSYQQTGNNFEVLFIHTFLICLALLYGTKPKTIFQKSLELTLKLS